MRVLFSRTGSDGNATVIESSDGSLLCIDSGIRYDIVNRAVGYRLHECKTLLISHLHSDHFCFSKNFIERGMSIYYPQGFSSKENEKFQFDVDGFSVVSFRLIHTNSDGTECPCYGFLIRDNGNGEKLLHCTDTQFVPYSFGPLERYSLEGNYFETDSYLDIFDSIEKSVEARRTKSHMSIDTMSEFLSKQDLSKCKEIRVLHISSDLTKAERECIPSFIQERIKRSDIKIVY